VHKYFAKAAVASRSPVASHKSHPSNILFKICRRFEKSCLQTDLYQLKQQPSASPLSQVQVQIRVLICSMYTSSKKQQHNVNGCMPSFIHQWRTCRTAGHSQYNTVTYHTMLHSRKTNAGSSLSDSRALLRRQTTYRRDWILSLQKHLRLEWRGCAAQCSWYQLRVHWSDLLPDQ